MRVSMKNKCFVEYKSTFPKEERAQALSLGGILASFTEKEQASPRKVKRKKETFPLFIPDLPNP